MTAGRHEADAELKVVIDLAEAGLALLDTPTVVDSRTLCTMKMHDCKGTSYVYQEDDLRSRMDSVRTGDYGGFILSHDDEGPSLWILINKDVAYIHYFNDNSGQHPGFQATGMTPAGCAEQIHFLQPDGSEADSITMPRETLLSTTNAYRAAIEFMNNPIPPVSIRWFEL